MPALSRPSVVMPEPNAFAAAFLAGCQAFNDPPASRLDLLKVNWQIHRQFVEWVAMGEDVKAYEAIQAQERALEERRLAVEEADRAAAAKQRAERQAAYAAK